MPSFPPGAQKTAVAPITVRPAGLACKSEIFLGPNVTTKVATSGLINFTSTGAEQVVRHPVVMPASPGTYHVYIDVYAMAELFLAYIGAEDVVVAAPALPFTYTFACTKGTCPSASAYGIAVMSGTIKNNNSILVSQNVKVMWARYRKLYGDWSACAGGTVPDRENCVCTQTGNCLVNPFLVTLAPGAQKSFSYKGYCVDSAGDTVCKPLLAMHYDYYFWLEDDAGGKSNEVLLST